jgi:AcrR family transcriptional regulator
VAEKGFAGTTVADVVERASVSRTTFYEQFPDKEACFLAAFNFGAEFVLGRIRAAREALGGERDWRDHVRSDLTTLLTALASEPAFASALHVEVLAAGPAALRRRAEIMALFTERLRCVHELARNQDPSLPELPHAVFEIHSGGLDELIRECLLTRGAQALPELAEPAIAATLAMLGN